MRGRQMLMRRAVSGHLDRGTQIVDAGPGFGRVQLEQPPHRQELRVGPVDVTRVVR
jgi:hypothetical protein